MTPERAEKQRIATETLMADEVTRAIYAQFLSHAQGFGNFTLADICGDYHFRAKKEAHAFFLANQDKLLPLIVDALPDFTIRQPAKSALHVEPPAPEKVFVFQFDESRLASIPADMRDAVRSLGDGQYVVQGSRDLMDKLGLTGKPPAAGAPPPPADAPLGSPRFSMKRSEVSSNFQKFRELQAAAEAEGQVVQFTD